MAQSEGYALNSPMGVNSDGDESGACMTFSRDHSHWAREDAQKGLRSCTGTLQSYPNASDSSEACRRQ